ncbi:MAG TPA: hypothetical protein VLC46_01085 [Thermoanaerobaculia bacterium]|jgi:hypothetical protein|nr:hypothetical protein [Thermoanaerobaculia bacterium]
MKHGITVLEMRGFAAMATSLGREMDRVALTSERVRAGVVHVIDTLIDRCRAAVPVIRAVHIGGDSWFIESQTLDKAVEFGVLLLRSFELKAIQGLYYLKPALATAYGEPKLMDGKFLDDTSIAAYRAADLGKPFRYELVGEAVEVAKQFPWIVQATEPRDDQTIFVVNWRESWPGEAPAVVDVEVTLPKLLLDSEVLYSSSAKEALSTIQQHQAAAKTVHAFGGPVPLNIPMYRAYVKQSIALVRDASGPSFSVLSYVPENEPDASFAWLELCRRLSIQYDTRYSFRAFPIPQGALRPFSFQIFDDDTVHLGLRAYSSLKGTPTMSSAILLRNREIAGRFKGEFIENWRTLDSLAYDMFAVMQKNLHGLSAASRKAALADVDALLNDTA